MMIEAALTRLRPALLSVQHVAAAVTDLQGSLVAGACSCCDDKIREHSGATGSHRFVPDCKTVHFANIVRIREVVSSGHGIACTWEVF